MYNNYTTSDPAAHLLLDYLLETVIDPLPIETLPTIDDTRCTKTVIKADIGPAKTYQDGCVLSTLPDGTFLFTAIYVPLEVPYIDVHLWSDFRVCANIHVPCEISCPIEYRRFSKRDYLPQMTGFKRIELFHPFFPHNVALYTSVKLALPVETTCFLEVTRLSSVLREAMYMSVKTSTSMPLWEALGRPPGCASAVLECPVFPFRVGNMMDESLLTYPYKPPDNQAPGCWVDGKYTSGEPTWFAIHRCGAVTQSTNCPIRPYFETRTFTAERLEAERKSHRIDDEEHFRKYASQLFSK